MTTQNARTWRSRNHGRSMDRTGIEPFGHRYPDTERRPCPHCGRIYVGRWTHAGVILPTHGSADTELLTHDPDALCQGSGEVQP